MSRGRIAIIGGSMAGLFAAVALRRQGWQVDVYERARTALANRGAGIATHAELYSALQSAGIPLHDDMGVESTGRIIFDAAGQNIGECDMPQIMTSWGLIYRYLRAQLPDEYYHTGYSARELRLTADSIDVVFDNGEVANADWVIGADGARSTVREIVAPGATLNYCGYFGWRGLIDENLISAAVMAELSHRMAFCMAPGGHWLGYLVAGANDEVEPGRRWYNWGWYRTGDANRLKDLLTDERDQYHPDGIPHHLIRAEHRQTMRNEANEFLAPQVRAVIDATAQPFLQGMYDVASLQLVFERVCLIGDAAFTARPHVGLGVSKAADDAAKLAVALSDDDPTTLSQWETERLKFGAAVVQWGRDLGSYIGPPPPDAAARKKAAYYQRPDVLISVTAATDPYPLLELNPVTPAA